jgi:DNA-binding Lrp family transcriptional regulator
VRYPPFRAELYDFDMKTWKMDWNSFGLFSTEVGPSFVSVNRDSTVDFIDLKILRSLMDDPTIPLAKAAKSINANPRTVRYHNTEHVTTGKFILSSNIRWVKPVQEGRPGSLMQVVFLFRKLDEQGIQKVRKFCNNLPFTWFEGGTEDRTYLAIVDVPIESFHETMQKAELYLRVVDQGYETMLLDPSSSKSLGIPDEMFDKERGWRLFNLPGQQQPDSIEETAD